MKSLVRILIAAVLLLSASAAFAQDSVQPDTPLLLQGQVLDTDGSPVAGAVVEIWQTDINGTYDHPGDSVPADLVSDFQYYGTATTDADGWYAFLTIKPGEYEPRPVHIHYKVKIDGDTVLTSQFYFVEDGTNADPTQLLTISDTQNTDGAPLRTASADIVLDLNGPAANQTTPTAPEMEGPFYPVVDFSGYDNDLLDPQTDQEPLLPLLDAAAASAEFTLLNLNTATGDDFLAIPGMSGRIVREFEEYRPYVSIAQFRREIGKYVSADVVAGYEAYVYVPVDFNASDALTLMQIPGVDETAAETLIAARPFASAEAFLDALAAILPQVDTAYAANFLAVP